MIKLMIGITTYNRKELISYTSASLFSIRNLNFEDVYVFDDCSTAYDEVYLKSIYSGANIIRFHSNLGADKNIERAYRCFLNSDYDYFFNADSDLVFSENILDIIEDIVSNLKKEEPILFSVFNTKNHLTIDNFNEKLLIKKDVGACGTIFNKKAIHLFINKLPLKYEKRYPSVDHAFCAIYKKEGFKILCTKKSYVQHIGIDGQNSSSFNFDWGENFCVENFVNAKALLYVYDKYFKIESLDIENRILELARKERFGINLSFRVFLITMKNKIKKIFRRKK